MMLPVNMKFCLVHRLLAGQFNIHWHYLLNSTVNFNPREICEQLGIASYTIDDIDKDGIGVIIEKALKRINPK